MIIETILYKALEIGAPIVVEKVGEKVWKQLLPPIQKARRAAVEKMAEELGPSFPTEAFLRLNFRFDSQIMQNELKKIMSSGRPDENVMKQEMAKELSNFPQFADRAEEIVESFLKYFEIECLGSEELKGITVASIIREEGTATRQFFEEKLERHTEYLEAKIAELGIQLSAQVSPHEKVTPKVVTALERRFIEERDFLIDSIKKWKSEGLYERIKKLAEDVFEVRKDINPVISGSIFRLFGSFLLRSREDHDAARYWIGLAEEVESGNPKNAALKAELLGSQGNWKEAKEILDPIVEGSEESLVKIIYAESLAQTSDFITAFHWLKSHGNPEQDDMKLNLAIFAVKADEHDYALDIIEDLKKKPFPGPYPYLLTAEILAKQAHSKELITISVPEDIELQKNYALLNEAIDNLTTCIELMKAAARPPKEIAYVAQNISELSLMIGDNIRAEKYLYLFWKQLRQRQGAWFTAASVAAQKGKKGKALHRAQRALDISKEKSKDPIFRFAILCLSIEEWDRCLDAVKNIHESDLDEDHRRALMQMRLVCYFQKKDLENAEKEIALLREKFPQDEMWVIHKALILRQLGKADEAIKLLAEESSKVPDSIKIKIRLAAFYKEKRMYVKAIPLYKGIAEAMRSSNAFEMACIVAFEANEPDEVLSIIEEADKAEIHSENLTHFKAFALTMDKQYDKALSLFSSFLEGSLNHNDYIFHAICYANRANPQKAISILSKAKEKYPEDIRIPKSLYQLYLEVNEPEKAFKEASVALEANPEDKAAYFALMQAGFACGEGEEASKALSIYLSRFGEGPELRIGKIEDIKELMKVSSERTESTWRKYQDGVLPEITLSQDHTLGVGGYRLMLLDSAERVMAFSGSPDAQTKQRLDILSSNVVLLDYHALITIHRLSLFKEALAIFGSVGIPDVVLNKIREDLLKLSTSYQRDRRLIEEAVFSKAKHQFNVHEEFLKIDLRDIPESIGNAIYDLYACKELGCAYVTPGFESQELTDVNTLFRVDCTP